MGNSLWVHLCVFPHVLFNKLFTLHWNIHIYIEKTVSEGRWCHDGPRWSQDGWCCPWDSTNRWVSHRLGQPCEANRDTSLELWLEDSGAPARAQSQGHEEGSTSRAMMLPIKPVSLGPEGRWCYFYYGKCSLWILGKELGQCTECEKVNKIHV